MIYLFQKYHQEFVRLTKKNSHIDKIEFIVGVFRGHKVYLTTHTIKHLYDKRTALEFDIILYNLEQLIFDSDKVLKNQDGRKGDIALTKSLSDGNYILILEKVERRYYILTVFRIDKKGLKKFSPISEWRDGTSHRNAF